MGICLEELMKRDGFSVYLRNVREREEERGVDLVFPCLRNAREGGLEFAFSVLEK